MDSETYGHVYMCEKRPGFPCEFQERNSEEVCKYCGRIGRRILYTGQQKVFEHEDMKNLHADEGKSLGTQGTTLSREAFTSNVTNLNPGYKARDRTKEGIERVKPKDIANEKYRHKLENYCSDLKLNRKTQEECLKLFDMIAVSSKNGISKTQVTPILLGILFHGCKKGDVHLTVKDLAKLTVQPEDKVRRGIKLVEDKCKVSADKATVESSGIIERTCIKLGMEKAFINVFVPNAKIVDDEVRKILEGKKPATIAATDIALTLDWFYRDQNRWTLQKIADTADLSQATLKKSIGEVTVKMKESGKTVEAIVSAAKALCR